MEEWRDIQGYEGIYQVSNEGRVRSLKFGKERILRPRNICTNHLQVVLSGNQQLVHQLVAKAFIPNPNGCDVVHHIDRNPLNNNVENLMWMTSSEHTAMHDIGCRRRTDQIDKTSGEVIRQWRCALDAEKELGISRQGISMCCNGKAKTHKGFVWKYLKNVKGFVFHK